jgi:hypothetical protein
MLRKVLKQVAPPDGGGPENNVDVCIAKTHLFGKSLIFSEEAETLSE